MFKVCIHSIRQQLKTEDFNNFHRINSKLKIEYGKQFWKIGGNYNFVPFSANN